MSGLQIMYYVSILFFFVMVIVKMIKIARMPVHLRWDLYPIPHEKGREDYGGSYYEEVDWWLKPKQFSLINEIKEMIKEIVFIQSVFKHNRPLWFFFFCGIGGRNPYGYVPHDSNIFFEFFYGSLQLPDDDFKPQLFHYAHKSC